MAWRSLSGEPGELDGKVPDRTTEAGRSQPVSPQAAMNRRDGAQEARGRSRCRPRTPCPEHGPPGGPVPIRAPPSEARGQSRRCPRWVPPVAPARSRSRPQQMPWRQGKARKTSLDRQGSAATAVVGIVSRHGLGPGFRFGLRFRLGQRRGSRRRRGRRRFQCRRTVAGGRRVHGPSHGLGQIRRSILDPGSILAAATQQGNVVAAPQGVKLGPEP